MDMNVKAEIEWIRAELEKIEDPEFIHMIKQLIGSKEGATNEDWWSQIPDNVKRSIDRGYKDLQEGHVRPFSEVREDIRAKYGV